MSPLARLAAFISEITGVDEHDVVPVARLSEDLDIDSIARVELMVGCEDRFGVRIPDDVAAELQSVQDVLDYVERESVAP